MIIEWVFWTVLLLLLHSYAVYPMLAVLVGAGRGERSLQHLPGISLLVPAHNEASVIEAKIRNFHQIDYPPELIELVIADDGSDDQTRSIVQPLTSSRVRLLESGQRGGKAAAMNRLATAAQHSYLLFSDANVIFDPNAVRRLIDPMGNGKVGAVTGEVRLLGSDLEFSPGEELYYRLERRIQGAESRMGSVMGVDGGMYLVRQELFTPLPTDTILDDFLVSIRVMRAGRRVVYESAAKATESGTPTARQEFARRTRIAAGAVQLLKRRQVPRWTQPILWLQFISHKLLRWTSPLLLLILAVSNVCLILRGLHYQLLLALQILGLAAMLATCWFPRLRNSLLGGVVFYFAMSQAAIAVGLLRGLLNRQAPQWEKPTRVHPATHRDSHS
ncbi:glycosyltransferase family 2 protein [Aureliella helgolandensis]|uniref:Poly-beta-1,6-N-acetyl-D-glucosamine synthase n=1 Tax=Aureliella helgolandensis TaxID=2527968 RepID=A0A518GE59_9BACT|nr:glycosyltransferase family 2 protein [Aureliella helgolandensis]QDV26828.1 Poly-beta-1,6-N-acetyl-D-glucosamine synthase [Aureliella helgolandensis]